MAQEVPKINLSDLLTGMKTISGTTTNTSKTNTAYNQQSLDQLMAALLAANPQYSKDAAIADATGTTQRVSKAIQQQQPQLMTAQMGAGLQSSTTGSLLQNDLVNQILMAEGALQQQQIKDYATIQNQQAQTAAMLAQAGNTQQVQQIPGMGLESLLAPLAISYGGQYAYDKLFGGAEAGKAVANVAGGSLGTGANVGALTQAPAINTGGTYLGNTLVNPQATVYPASGVQLAEAGAPVVDYSGMLAKPSAAYTGSQTGMLAGQTANTGAATFSSPDAASWFADDAANAAMTSYGSAAPTSFASSMGFDVAPGFGNVGGGAFAAANTLAQGGSIGEAGMEGTKGYLAMSNPYTAAAYIVDQVTGGAISDGLTDVSDAIGIKEPVDDLWKSGSDAVTGAFKSVGLKSVICTAMYSQGLITKAQWKASSVYRARHVDDRTYQYYLGWATPIANSITANTTGKYSIKEHLAMFIIRGFLAVATNSSNKLMLAVGKLAWAYNKYQAARKPFILHKATIQ